MFRSRLANTIFGLSLFGLLVFLLGSAAHNDAVDKREKDKLTESYPIVSVTSRPLQRVLGVRMTEFDHPSRPDYTCLFFMGSHRSGLSCIPKKGTE